MNEQFDMLFELVDGNVFTKENLKAIKAVEEDFTSISDYDKYCLLEGTPPACRPPQSVIRLFDGSFPGLAADPDFNNIIQYLNTVNSTVEGRQLLLSYLGKLVHHSHCQYLLDYKRDILGLLLMKGCLKLLVVTIGMLHAAACVSIKL